MSLKTWKAEFYPIHASEIKDRAEAVKHSLKKWEGLTENNLEKHSVSVVPGGICDQYSTECLPIGESTCALCNLYAYDEDDEDNDEDMDCAECPLVDVRKGVPCDWTTPREHTSPFGKWVRHRNPRPMITLLRKALAKL